MIYSNYKSWGRYPILSPSKVSKLFWRDEIPVFSDTDISILPYGLGKSYGDSCLNENGLLVDCRGLNKIIAFDKINGIIKVESGVTLAEILNFVVPHGWFLASTPGTKLITVGGAIANDVHGKNHHKGGTFGYHLNSFELVRSDGSRLICSPNENKELFAATIGGLGLTGIITWAEFRLLKSPTAFFATESIKFKSIEEFFEINAESEHTYDFTVSWIDTTSQGSNFGRGIFNRGNQADPSIHDIPTLPKDKAITFPLDAPFINGLSVKAFNSLYYSKQIPKVVKQISHYNPFFYPLDAVYDWNKAYGKNGFIQYQFVIPFGNELKGIKTILRKITESGLSSFLTVLKTFGSIKSPGMLSFPRPGVTMAVDFRMGSKTLAFADECDKLIRDYGGVLYPAKDARMSAENFKVFYPEWIEFSKYIDPKFSSSFWRRVTK